MARKGPCRRKKRFRGTTNFPIGSVNWLAFVLAEAFYCGAAWDSGELGQAECEWVGENMAQKEWKSFIVTAEELLKVSSKE